MSLRKTSSRLGRRDATALTGTSGSVTDQPPTRCEGTSTLVYTLALRDSADQTETTDARVSITWVC